MLTIEIPLPARLAPRDTTTQLLCRCVLPSGETLFVPPHVLGAALMASEGEAPSLPWIDLLASMGMAVRMGGNSIEFLLSTPPKVETVRDDLTWEETGERSATRQMIPVTIPALLWWTKWNRDSGRMEGSRLYQTTERVTTIGPTPLHPWGWGNVYGAGKICWGQVVTTGLRLNPGEVPRMFFNSGFNGDLVRGVGDRVGGVFAEAVRANPAHTALYNSTSLNIGRWGLLFPTVPLPNITRSLGNLDTLTRPAWGPLGDD